MTNRLETTGAALSFFFCVVGSGCDQAEPREREVEPTLASASLRADAPVRNKAESLQPSKLEPAPVEPMEPIEPGGFDEGFGGTCGPSQISRPADLCPPGRLVGKFAKGCPSPYGDNPVPEGDHWEVVEVFENVKGLPEGLEGYCRYEWTGQPGSEIAALPNAITDFAKPDCRVFPQSPMGVPLRGAYTRAFHEGTRPLPQKPSQGHPVLVAIVDTAPASASLDQAGHGQAMAAIAGELAAGCVPKLGETDKNCKRKVKTWLGLPQTVEGPDFTKGGFFGYQSDLALGIMQAVSSWPEAGDQKLVVNLSVGWEPVANEFSGPTPAVQAVRDAIAIGRCRGALVISASGNRPVGTCFDQATGPGGWEREPGPSAAKCTGLGVNNHVVPTPPNPLPTYYPFLYASTPLDWHNESLSSYRDGSNARLSTTGFGGFDEVGGRFHGPVTGSSVSTATLSGIAALVWSYFYGLRADEVMDLIYAAGTPTNADADLHIDPNGAPPQHQVTACGVLQWACDSGRVGNWLRNGQQHAPSVCSSSALANCTGTDPDVDVSAWGNEFTIAFGQLSSSQSSNSNSGKRDTLNCTQCGAPQTTQLSARLETEPEPMGWVLPQPHKHPCPLCHVKGPDLYLSIDPDYDTYTLQTFSVYLYDSAGGSEVLHYSSRDLAVPLSSATVEILFDTEFQTVTSGLPPMRAEIAMTFSDPATGRPITASNSLSIE